MGDLAVASFLEEQFADLPEVIGVQELAEKLRKSPKTIYRYLETDVLPGYPVGNTWVIWKAAVIERLERNRQERLDRASAGGDPVSDDDLGLPED